VVVYSEPHPPLHIGYIMKINKIVIVGGGSAGWMTAAALAHKCPNIKLTLVESNTINTIGVGESTLGQINYYMELLGIKDEEWMAACNATYKASIQFTDFRDIGSTFQYPFGDFSAAQAQLDISPSEFLTLRELYPDDVKVENFGDYYSINGLMARHNKISGEPLPQYGYNPRKDLAYHMDATLFGQYLKGRFCSDIEHLIGDVDDAEMDAVGNIESISLSTGEVLAADMFIDCTGFKSLLIEKKLGVPFIEFEKLPNDKAVAAKVPYADEEDKISKLHNVTDCKGLSSGWLWNIPLWDRAGTGYVYSSKFQSTEDAEAEFRKETNWDGEVNHIDFRHGYHEKAWHKNVVAIGLSFGFIEPLESTGLLTTHSLIMLLVRVLLRNDGLVNSIDREHFNKHSVNEVVSLSDFVAIHYGLSSRRDTPYWRYVTEDVEYKHEVLSESDFGELNSYLHTSLVYVALGMGWSPQQLFDESMFEPLDKVLWEENKNLLTTYTGIVDTFIHTLPTHYEYLVKNIYKD